MCAEFVIRAAGPQDSNPIGGLLRASYPALMGPSYDQAVLTAALPFMTKPISALLSSGIFYVTESMDHRVVGCGGWSLDRPGSGETIPGLAHIRHFAVHPDWVRQGIGRALYEACEDAARRAGVRHVECYSSLNAVVFYTALGFSSVGRVELSVGPDLKIPSVLMERSI